jgi:hypothetical protein
MTQPAKSPSISVRNGIAFGFSPPYEDTTTLVLTSPAGRFVDLRFPLFPSDTTSRTNPVPYQTHPTFWAFAGSSSSSEIKPRHGESPTWDCASHCVWTHELDSRGEGIKDEGDIWELKDGGSVEIGVMNDPATGKEEWYKEYWTSPEEALLPCVVAEVVDGTTDGPRSSDTGPSKRKLRGRIIRLGKHIQGIWEASSEGADVRVERLAYEQYGGNLRWNVQQPDWVEREADRTITPCSWLAFDEQSIPNVGDEMSDVDANDQPRLWRIIECIK